MIYLLIIFTIFVCAYRYDFRGLKSNKLFWYYSLMVVLILLAGLRYRIGVDSIRYERAYEYLPSINSLSIEGFAFVTYEPFYLILSSVAKSLSEDFWVMQMIHALLINIVVFRFIRLNCRHLFCALLLYFVFLYSDFMFETMRESCAVSMFLLGWEYIKKDRWGIFCIFAVIALGFHVSAIVLLGIPLLKFLGIWNNLKINKLSIPFFFFVALIGLYVGSVIFNYIAQLNFGELMTQKAEQRVDSVIGGQVMNVFGMMVTIVRYVLFPFLACVSLKHTLPFDKNVESMLFLCFTFIVLSFGIALLYRFNNYFYIFAIVVMSDMMFLPKISISKNKFIRVGKFRNWFFIILVVLSVQINKAYMASISNTRLKEYMRYFPYSSIVNKEKNSNREQVFQYYNAF